MRVLVFGATSAIAEQACRQWAERGASLCIAARDELRLEAIAADLRLRGGREVAPVRFDALPLEPHAPIVAEAWRRWGGFDVVLLAHGSLPDPAVPDPDGSLTAREFELNATSTLNLMTLVAARLESQKGGVLAVVSSVAGDRGRASNAIYGAAKAAVTAYASALRQRLARAGAWVVTIKPGFVDTPMTAGFQKGVLWASPEKVASDIVRAVDRRKAVCYTPRFWRWIMLVIRFIPERVFCRLTF